jgi:hypothetical protein
VDNTESFKLIGIHNQHPAKLFVQFSLGDRYFMYEFNRCDKIELIREQCFETIYAERRIDPQEEDYLIGKLKFFPKTKRVINEYRYHA